MNREEARSKAVGLLLGDNIPNNDFYADTFMSHNYGDPEMTPISPLYMNNVNLEHDIVLTEEVYNDLHKIKDITEQTNNEVPYLLLGEEQINGSVLFDTVLSTYEPSNRTSANFSKLNQSLNDYIKAIEAGHYNNGKKQVVCHGHTHGKSSVSDNFSFGDLISYIQMTNSHPIFKSREVETIGMLLPPSGDYNFIMYENNPHYEGFYTFPKVYVKENNGVLHSLPAYQNGNYLGKDSFSR